MASDLLSTTSDAIENATLSEIPGWRADLLQQLNSLYLREMSELSVVGSPSDLQSRLQKLYSQQCKFSFERLSESLQRVKGIRKEIRRYLGEEAPSSSGNPHCFSCLAASLRQTLDLLHRISSIPDFSKALFENHLVDLLWPLLEHSNSRISALSGATLAEMSRRPEVNTALLERIQAILQNRSTPPTVFRLAVELLVMVCEQRSPLWENRMRVILSVFFDSLKNLEEPGRAEFITLPLMNCLLAIWKQRDFSTPLVRPTVKAAPWLAGSNEFDSWLRLHDRASPDLPEAEKTLLRKYVSRWRTNLRSSSLRICPLEALSQDSWLVALLFHPTSPRIRSTAAKFLKALSQSNASELIGTLSLTPSTLGRSLASRSSVGLPGDFRILCTFPRCPG